MLPNVGARDSEMVFGAGVATVAAGFLCLLIPGLGDTAKMYTLVRCGSQSLLFKKWARGLSPDGTTSKH